MAEPREATLYVWGRREIARAWEDDPGLEAVHDSRGDVAISHNTPSQMVFTGGFSGGSGTGAYESAWELPEDQISALELVRRVATRCSVPLGVVDLGERRHLRLREEAHKKGWNAWPVLVGPQGRTIVGSTHFAEKEVEDTLVGVLPPSH